MKNILTFVTALLLGGATAQVTISGPRSLEASPGEHRTVEYTIQNATPEPVDVAMFVQDLAQLGDGATVHLEARTTPTSLSHIMSFQTTSARVPAGQSVTIPAQVDVPEGSLPGYWGVVGVDTPAPAEGEGQVGLRVRYAMVTKLDVTGLAQHQLLIHDVAAPSSGGAALQLTIENAGTSYERAEATLEFYDTTGPVGTARTSFVILPGSVVDLPVTPPEGLEAGSYGVFTTVEHAGTGTVEHMTSIQITP